MKVSKTQFKNLIKCRRYAALYEIYSEKDEAIVSTHTNNEVDVLMSFENKANIQMLLNEMYDDQNDIDLINIKDEQLEIMLPFYNKLELIVGDIIKRRFGGKVIYDVDTYKQKQFSYLKDDYEFYCFLDGYQEDEDVIRIFETKTTTSSKFDIKNFNFNINDEKETFFININDIYYPYNDFYDVSESSNYSKKEESLFDRFNDKGKYVYDLIYQRNVIRNSIKSNKRIEYYLVVLNHEYIYDGKVDGLKEPIYDDSIVRFYDMTSIVNKSDDLIEADINTVIKRLNEMDSNPHPISKDCKRGGEVCMFYNICYSEFPKENSIFTYLDNHHGFKDQQGNKYDTYDLINNRGYKTLLDVPSSLLNRRNNLIQRNVVESNLPYYNKDKIRAGLKLLKYPIYHLDFETFNAPLPRYEGESPYTQSVFQYSVHIERTEGVLDIEKDNYSFLAKDHLDHRREMIESLLAVIKDDGGSVLTYNVSFERSRLKELSILFPEYRDKINNIIERLFDLIDIVKGNKKLYTELGFNEVDVSTVNFYHNDLNGSYSIKKVLPIFSDLNYDNLEVSNGVEAMVTYQKFKEMSKDEYETSYNNLLEYCKQDTFAMFEILNKLREI